MRALTEKHRRRVKEVLEETRPSLDSLCFVFGVLFIADYMQLSDCIRQAIRYYRDDKVHVHLAEAYRLARQAGIITAADER